MIALAVLALLLARLLVPEVEKEDVKTLVITGSRVDTEPGPEPVFGVTLVTGIIFERSAEISRAWFILSLGLSSVTVEPLRLDGVIVGSDRIPRFTVAEELEDVETAAVPLDTKDDGGVGCDIVGSEAGTGLRLGLPSDLREINLESIAFTVGPTGPGWGTGIGKGWVGGGAGFLSMGVGRRREPGPFGLGLSTRTCCCCAVAPTSGS